MPKISKKKTNPKDDWSDLKRQISQMANQAEIVLTSVKTKYEELDPKTKKKVLAGIAGLGVVLAAASHYHRQKKQRSSNK